MVTPSWATKPSRIARDGYDLDEVDAELHLPLHATQEAVRVAVRVAAEDGLTAGG
jgi:Ser/Thr protein kinase RdoA (MazF antagonist)